MSSSNDKKDEVLAKIQKALQHVFDLAAGREKWTMRIPAREEWDSDCILADALSEAEKYIRSLPSASSAWQPIETAPKQGAVEQLLLYVPTLHGTGGKVIAHWAHGGGEEQPAFGPAWFFWTGYDFRELTDKPSHWMRLPHCPADWRDASPPYVKGDS